MSPTLFADLAGLAEQLEATNKRGELAVLLAGFLRSIEPAEVVPATRLIIGRVFPEWDQAALNVSWKAVMAVVDEMIDAPLGLKEQVWSEAIDGGQGIRMLLERARRTQSVLPRLTVVSVFEALTKMAQTAGRGSRARKDALLRGLLMQASPIEAKHLVKVVLQEMRHGVSEGILLESIAKAAGVAPAMVRRANQFWCDVGEVASVVLAQGNVGLASASLRPFRPLRPMLADAAEEIGEAFARYGGRFALEYKLDGARVQIHRHHGVIRIYSRNLADVSASLPDVRAALAEGLGAAEAILDGEVIAVDARGRPLPFLEVMRRFGRKHDVVETVRKVPVRLYLFDLLSLDGRPLVDCAYEQRWSLLETVAGGLPLVRRLVPDSIDEARLFAERAFRDGHEGVMVKDLRSLYTPGLRGRSWLKLKHSLSLDLVIVAADGGYGRRHGWLSNYHLAARDVETGEYLVVGKTFKGMTDQEFDEMTRRLLAVERTRSGGTVFVEPRVVVEVQFNEIQSSSQYPSGLALRFARIVRIRDDKPVAEAEGLDRLRRLYEAQFAQKGQAG